jgi:ADP-heptose:LPS heptosyltransferase
MTEARPARILVIRLGALGDFVLSFPAFAAIRAHHAGARIALLTTAPYADLARAMPWVDEVRLDERPRPWQARKVLALRRRLAEGRFDRVYDLQTSHRTGWYFRLMPRPRPEWSGNVRGCSHRQPEGTRRRVHVVERQRDQLALAGVPPASTLDLDWLVSRATPSPLMGEGRGGGEGTYAVLVPGSSAHRPDKRWPAERFAALATWLGGQGIRPVLVGTGAEATLAAAIARAAPSALDLAGRTGLLELAGVLRGARLVVGNDTGPMHLAALLGRPCVVLYGAASDPARTAPRGPSVAVLRCVPLALLATDAVIEAGSGLLDRVVEGAYEPGLQAPLTVPARQRPPR